MPVSMLFWLLMLLLLFFGCWACWPERKACGGGLLLWAILFLIGWKVFGFILK